MRKDLTSYPSVDIPQSKESTFFEKNPIIPSVDMKLENYAWQEIMSLRNTLASLIKLLVQNL